MIPLYVVKRAIRAITTVMSVVVAGAAPAQLPSDVAAKYSTPLVEEKDGKLVLERYRVCQIIRPQAFGGGESQPFRVRSRTQAPIGFMSRDNFVAFATEIGITLRVGLVGELIKGMPPAEALDALQCKDLPKAGVQVDFEADVKLNGMDYTLSWSTRRRAGAVNRLIRGSKSSDDSSAL